MDDSKQPYAIGDTVFVAWAYDYDRELTKCGICFGDRRVKVTLGNGEEWMVDCDACGHGYERPSGMAYINVPRHGVREEVVTGVEHDYDGWTIKTASNSHRISDGCVFATRAEAIGRETVMAAEQAERVEKAHARNMMNHAKKHAWTLHYSRGQIREAERTIAWHRARIEESKR